MNQSSNNPLNTYVLYSGGAYGADQIFGVLAHKYGVGKQFHIRPVGNEKIHKSLSKVVRVALHIEDLPSKFPSKSTKVISIA